MELARLELKTEYDEVIKALIAANIIVATDVKEVYVNVDGMNNAATVSTSDWFWVKSNTALGYTPTWNPAIFVAATGRCLAIKKITETPALTGFSNIDCSALTATPSNQYNLCQTKYLIHNLINSPIN